MAGCYSPAPVCALGARKLRISSAISLGTVHPFHARNLHELGCSPRLLARPHHKRRGWACITSRRMWSAVSAIFRSRSAHRLMPAMGFIDSCRPRRRYPTFELRMGGSDGPCVGASIAGALSGHADCSETVPRGHGRRSILRDCAHCRSRILAHHRCVWFRLEERTFDHRPTGGDKTGRLPLAGPRDMAMRLRFRQGMSDALREKGLCNFPRRRRDSAFLVLRRSRSKLDQVKRSDG